LISTRFIVSGLVQQVNYGAWIRRQALDLSLNGYIKHLKDGNASVIVSGERSSINKFKDIIFNHSSKNALVSKVVIKERNSPVKIGFEIKNLNLDRKIPDGYHPVRLKNVKTRINKNKSRGKKSKNAFYKKEYTKLINSTSWKITKPLRYIGKKVKSRR